MDLTALSDADFAALQSGDLKGMSEAGFAQLLRAQAAAMPPAEKRRLHAEGDRQRLEGELISSMPQGERFSAAMGKSVSDVGTALAQAVPGSGVTRQSVDEMRQRDAPLLKTGAGKAGYLIGSGLVAAPLMMAPGANTVAGSALYGGAMGALSPVGSKDDATAPVLNALIGAGGGAAAAGGANMLSRIVQPKPQAGVKELIDAGVTLTPGQRLGGAWKRAEDALTSVPIVGDAIRSGQRESFKDFNAAIANRALKPLGQTLPAGTSGRDAVAFVESRIGDAYESALRQIKTVQADQAFNGELASLRNMVQQSTMPKEVQRQFESAIKNQITGKLQGQSTMTAQTFKDAESELGRLSAKYAADASADKQLLGDALQEAQAALRRLLERAAGPDLAGDVKAANTAWSEFKRMQRASTFLGAKDGVFSPENYMNAVKALDRSKDKGGFARGSALGQDAASDAVRVMGATVPDSGTPFRSLMTNPIGGTVSALIGSPLFPAYSTPGRNLLQALMSPDRPALATKLAAEIEAAKPALAAMGFTGANALQRLSDR